MTSQDIYDIIIEIIIEETLFLRHYFGQIVDNNDPIKKGRVKVTIPEIGMDTPDKALWCVPRQGASMIVPEIGKYAEIYFMNADSGRPVYIYPVTEIQGELLKNYTGNTKEKILFEDALNKSSNIKYKQATQEYVVNDGIDYAVKYNELKTAFDQLKTDHDAIINLLQTWVVAPNDGGAALQAAATALAPSTADMTNSKVEKVRLP